MNGHAGNEEIEVVKRLESQMDLSGSSVNDLLELAQLYIEPFHREAEAMAILEAVLKRDHNSLAKFWLAYCCLHYLMDPVAIRRAKTLLESVIQADPQHAGAAYMLLAEVLEEEGNLPVDQKIKMLETSVALEPDWVFNRQSLAWAYRQAGKFSNALEQIEKALGNVSQPDPSWSITRRNFEESITGRIGNRASERLTSDLQKLKPDLAEEAKE
jgi:tetratricopeptide (TPR) repeat protein